MLQYKFSAGSNTESEAKAKQNSITVSDDLKFKKKNNTIKKIFKVFSRNGLMTLNYYWH